MGIRITADIYNSRNSYKALDSSDTANASAIYNSRNSYKALDQCWNKIGLRHLQQ